MKACLLLLFLWAAQALAADLAALCADRTAIERVYYKHRSGAKPAFEQAMPAAVVEKLVREDLKKEVVLAQVYGATITAPMVEAEVQRIEVTTRAPEVLAEIKAALGNEPARFSRGVARPIVVERALRARFENDDRLHAGQRREAEQAREHLLAKESLTGTHEVTWQLGPRPEASKPELHRFDGNLPASPSRAIANSGAYSVEATAQVAQMLSTPDPAPRETAEFYFADLEPELQIVLRAQLREPGDVSAVIETPSAFLLFQAKEKTAAALTATSLAIPKRRYEAWLAAQPEPTP